MFCSVFMAKVESNEVTLSFHHANMTDIVCGKGF